MGKVFYDMGFLATAEVVECSATELIGSYVGHTGPKVQKVLENALDRVLFIDEAYRLAHSGFTKEAMDEIVDCLTKPKYAQKLIVILAGYDDDINRLMAQNPGLTSRFPEAVIFRGLDPDNCLDLLVQKLIRRKRIVEKKQKNMDLSVLENPSLDFKHELLDCFGTLGNIANWANARDVQTIDKNIFSLLLKADTLKDSTSVITEDHVRIVLNSMISERKQRQNATDNRPGSLNHDSMAKMFFNQATPVPQRDASSASALNTAETDTNHQPANAVTAAMPTIEVGRDPGVSDDVWQQLQRDKHAARQEKESYLQIKKASEDAANQLKFLQDKEEASERAYQQATKQSADQAEIQKAKQLREQARLKHGMDRRTLEALLAELENQRKAKEEQRKKEEMTQQKLRDLGVCSAGYRWTKRSGGYVRLITSKRNIDFDRDRCSNPMWN